MQVGPETAGRQHHPHRSPIWGKESGRADRPAVVRIECQAATGGRPCLPRVSLKPMGLAEVVPAEGEVRIGLDGE